MKEMKSLKPCAVNYWSTNLKKRKEKTKLKMDRMDKMKDKMNIIVRRN